MTNTGSNINTGGNLVLNARNDLTVEGSDVSAGDKAVLKAGNDIRIVSAQDHTRSKLDEEHLSGGAGVNFGSDGIGFTAYVAAGENDLDRQNTNHRNSTVNAGNELTIISGNDTDISGANLHSKVVDMDVGGNLTVASQQDTGSVEGKRWDVSASVTVGAGVSVSANVGYGETEGSSAWVAQQTSIVGSDSVNIKVGGHTQIDGALIANIKEDGTDGGNLVLDTGTLGYTNLKDHHEETSSYLSIGISTGGNSSTNESDKDGSWSVSGSYSDLDRKQETNATVGQGVVRVRNDEETGGDSTAGLNRDIDTAQVVTKDKETGFDLYVSSTAIDSIEGLFQKDENGNNKTLSRWADNITSVFDPEAYSQMFENVNKLLDVENIAQGWEEAKVTLGIREVQLPDSDNLQSSIESNLTQKQQDQLALLGEDIPANVELLAIDPEGNIIGYMENGEPRLITPEQREERIRSAEKLIGVVAQGDALLNDMAAFDEQLNKTAKDRFIAGYDATSKSNYEIDKLFAGSPDTGGISIWYVTLGEGAFNDNLGSAVQEGVWHLGNTVLMGAPGLLTTVMGRDIATPQTDRLKDYGYSTAEDYGISREHVDFTLAALGAVGMVKDAGGAISSIIKNPERVIDIDFQSKPRVGSANKVPDGQHGFNDIVDNYTGDASKFDIDTKGPGGIVTRKSELRQIEGSNNGVDGVYEWINDNEEITHRRFIPGGVVTGYPNQVPSKK